MSFSDSGAPSAVYGKKHQNHFPVDAFNTGIRMSPAAKSPCTSSDRRFKDPSTYFPGLHNPARQFYGAIKIQMIGVGEIVIVKTVQRIYQQNTLFG